MSTLHQHRSRPRRLLLDSSSSSSSSPSTTRPEGPANGIKTHGLYPNEANFDTNMVIILAALLCALIFALGLNSIVRCALRCSRRFSFENPDETAARLAATGLKKSTLRQIPIVAYGSGAQVGATDCPICLAEFLDGQKVRVLPKCNHGFHVRCIDTWFLSHSSCPTCRHSLLEPPPPAAASGNALEVGADNGNAATGAQGDHHVPIAVDEAP